MAEGARPDPDALLARVNEEERRAARGKLTIFFGASPGVGKTYSMLEAARVERAEGKDVVLGVVETHGRYDTAALLLGMELLPRRRLSYRGIGIEEFDLDGALARRPALIVVDELAHTNAEGSRNRKRWQDVEELRDAGIAVFTTLNVQHVESVNDVVSQITGVVVKETVPDNVISQADDLRLVDLPPDELLERLREGKVYVPDQARRAIDNFFRKGNLIALRELALRMTAERVDAEMDEYRREEGIERTWAVAEHVLVAVSWSPHSADLLRAAARMARRLRAKLHAVYVETPGSLRLGERDRRQLTQNLRIAADLGAEVVTVVGSSAVEEILAFARKHNVTRIVVGKPRERRLRELLRGSFVDELVRGSGDIDVHVTSGTEEHAAPVPTRPRAPAGWMGGLAALVAVAACTVVGWLLFGHAHQADVVMLYVLGTVLVALRFRTAAALGAAALSVLAYDYFFVPPYFSFQVSDVRHAVTFAVLLTVSAVISGLMSRVRAHAEEARDREKRTASLFGITRDLAQTAGAEALAGVGAQHVADVFGAGVAVFAPDATGTLALLVAHDDESIAASELGVARWAWEKERETGLTTDTLPGSRGFYLPVRGPRGKVAVLGVYPRDKERLDDPDHKRLLGAFASQLAMALERAALTEEMERARMVGERERLRSTLLSSVSHDLRTPLGAIMGAATTLLGSRSLGEATERELLVSVQEEAHRLNRLVTNLLEMTRLESGGLELKRELQPVEDVLGAVLGRFEERLRGRDVTVSIPSDLPPVHVDALLMEQVFVNLLENVLKYTPPGSPIDIRAWGEGEEVHLEIADRGQGIPEGHEERIFDKFHRGAAAAGAGGATSPPPGVGLGLAICRAVLHAHGGRISAGNRPGGGATFTLALPAEKQVRA